MPALTSLGTICRRTLPCSTSGPPRWTRKIDLFLLPLDTTGMIGISQKAADACAPSYLVPCCCGWYTQSVVARPHLPWAVPKEYYDLYPAAAEIAAPTHPEVPKGMYPMAWHAIPGPGFPTQWNVSLPGNSSRANRRAYYAAVSFLDHQVGIVLAELQQLGFANNTLVVFHSDHVSLTILNISVSIAT